MTKSPYVRNPARLADLIAAIQVMGTYRFASRLAERWETRLGRRPVSAANWGALFLEHPEFFTIQDGSVSLVWRRSMVRNYDTREGRTLSFEEASAMALQDKEVAEQRLSRPPLDASQMVKLVDIAINIHEREIQHQQERRWWIGAVLVILGIVLGAVLKA